MSKRKCLFERGDSFRDTGIPCGNPKRVQTRDVLCMPSSSSAASQGQGQDEDMETEGEMHLKAMAKKQLKTDFTKHELLSQRREFAEAGRYKPVTKEIRGMMGLQEYQDVAKGDQRVESLRQYGLSDDEIRLQLAKEGVQGMLEASVTRKSNLGTNPQVEQERLAAIQIKMKDKEDLLSAPDKFRDQKHLTRQQLDLEKSMFQGTQRDSNALSRLLTSHAGSDIIGDPSDPVNHLPDIMAEVEDRARERIREKRRRRRRSKRKGLGLGYNIDEDCMDKNEGDDDDDEEGDGSVPGCLTLEETHVLRLSQQSSHTSEQPSHTSEQPSHTSEQPLHSSEQSSHISEQSSHSSDQSSHTSKQSNQTTKVEQKCSEFPHNQFSPVSSLTTTLKDSSKTNKGAARKELDEKSHSSEGSSRTALKEHIEFLPVDFIKSNRLRLEEIKQLPKFETYEPGEPNNVLYLKNLAPKVSERDLVSLFGRFQKEAGSEVVYKLMTGRMRGQAFVTLPSTEVANEALQLINGFQLHGKPLIAQYGSKRTAA